MKDEAPLAGRSDKTAKPPRNREELAMASVTEGADDKARVVVVYERVSSDKQDLTRQAVQRERAKADHPDRELVVIQDDGVSAYRVSIFDRPGGRQLCELVESCRVEAICDRDSQDRLSRGRQSEWWNFADLCEQSGTRIVIDGRELRLDDEGDEIRSALDAILARRESREKSHRTRSGKALSASRGRRNGGPRPFGYQQQNVTLTLVRTEADLLRRIRSEVVAGISMSQVARDLNRDGITTVRGAKWTQTRVSQMLANRLYIGKGAPPRERVRGRTRAGVHTGGVGRGAGGPLRTPSWSRQRSRASAAPPPALARDAALRLLWRGHRSPAHHERAGEGL